MQMASCRRWRVHGETKVRRNTEIKIENRWVVPLLSKMFQAHINIEYSKSVKSVKYVCRYYNKCSGMAVFGVTNEGTNDEVMRCQLRRCTVLAATRQFDES